LHLHQYRLVCAVGVCFTRGQECTRCHGRNTLPGLRLNCRGSVGEGVAYAAALSLYQRRLIEQADAIVVPRLSPEKGVDVAIEACRRARMGLVVAGEGPQRAALERQAAGADVRLPGRVPDAELARLRAGAAIAIAPSR